MNITHTEGTGTSSSSKRPADNFSETQSDAEGGWELVIRGWDRDKAGG